VHGVDGRVGGAGGAALAPRVDDRLAALLIYRQEVVLQPLPIGDDLQQRPAVDPRLLKVRELRVAVVAPHGHIGHRADGDTGPGRDLGLGPVLVQAGHRQPAVGGDARRIAVGDHGVGVAGVGHDQHTDVTRRVVVDGPALLHEDLAVGRDQIGAIHAGGARFAASQQRPVGIPEASGRVIGQDDVLQQRVGAILQLHPDALQCPHRLRNLDDLQDDRLIGAKRLSGSDPKQQAVRDLAGAAGDGYTNRILHDRILLLLNG